MQTSKYTAETVQHVSIKICCHSFYLLLFTGCMFRFLQLVKAFSLIEMKQVSKPSIYTPSRESIRCMHMHQVEKRRT